MEPDISEETVERIGKMRAIIDAIVAHEPYFPADGESVCALCDSAVTEELNDEYGQHWKGCPYRMAAEFVAELRTAR